MDVKEKLIEILHTYAHRPIPADKLADHLLLHGVTVQVHSRWIYMGRADGKRIFRCENCDSLVYGAGDFCKVCGAKMDLPQISQRTAEALAEIGQQAHEVTP